MAIRGIIVFILLALNIKAGALAVQDLETRIVQQGVPASAVQHLFEFMKDNFGQNFLIPTYFCLNHPDSAKPCKMKNRVLSVSRLVLEPHRYAVIVDYTEDSLQKRFHLIDLYSGAVQSFTAAHGKGSGDGLTAYRFGDAPDSKETALGMYVTGQTYIGEHGLTLRLYGLQKSDENAYWRDIVLHGAKYMNPEFIKKIDPKTKAPYGRLGVSWGCPAVQPDVAQRIIPLLVNGSLIYNYQEQLAGLTNQGGEMEVPPPIPLPRPRPTNLH